MSDMLHIAKFWRKTVGKRLKTMHPLTVEILISYAFLAGHAARFMRVVCARASPAAPNSPVSPTSAEVGRAARRVWTWKMVEKESLGYEALLGVTECPPGDKRKRQGYGLRKFAQFRSPPPTLRRSSFGCSSSDRSTSS